MKSRSVRISLLGYASCLQRGTALSLALALCFAKPFLTGTVHLSAIFFAKLENASKGLALLQAFAAHPLGLRSPQKTYANLA